VQRCAGWKRSRHWRVSNNANIVCLPVRYTTLEQAEAIVKAFLEAEFEGGGMPGEWNKIPLGC